MKIKTAIGQDSHRFVQEGNKHPLILGGHEIQGSPGLDGRSDADVILHAITNAVSGITGVNILGRIADDMSDRGVTDSAAYLDVALSHFDGWKIEHVSISLECLKPRISPHIESIKQSLASLLNISVEDIGLTATTGEGLTDFGRGLGIQCIAILTASKV